MHLSFMHLRRKTLVFFTLCAAALFALPSQGSRRDDDWRDVWETSLTTASVKAKRDGKLILAYFRGSDWCPWCKKLEKEVLTTPAFTNWAKDKLVLLDVDLPSERVRQPTTIKQQNEQLKNRYNVTRTPTFVLIDPQGEEIERAGYDEAKLREDEKQGEPVAWLKHLEGMLTKRPDAVKLVEQPDLTDAVSFARSKARPLLMLVSKPDVPPARLNEVGEKILQDPKFVRFVNRHMAFVRLAWPADDDKSREAAAFRSFAKTYDLPPAPVQFVVWDPGSRKILERITTFTTARADPLILALERAMPRIDYTGNWLEDYRMAQAIAVQQDRDLFVLFTDGESGEWSAKLEAEILKSEPFRQYAGKNLVLVRLDFSKARHERKSPALKEQHETLADQHGVRGYPFMVIINPKMQKIGEAKYMKGGPGPFLAQLDQLRKQDQDRRILPSDQAMRR